jgi:hypothetical protein
MGLSFTIVAGPRQLRKSQIRSRGTHDHILLSDSRVPQSRGQVPVFISPRNRVARIKAQALSSVFIASYDSQGYSGNIRPLLHTSSNSHLPSDLRYTASKRPKGITTFLNNSSIVIEVCIPRRCIETTVLLLFLACSFPREPVYGAVA